MKSLNLKIAVAAVLLGATALAFGAPPPGKGGGGGGGGGKPPTESGNNLSVPLVMINGGFALSCADDGWSTLAPPVGEPVRYEEECVTGNDGPVCVEAGNYFVQGVHKWQAPCMRKTYAADEPRIEVYGLWGDNLAGDAKFKVGSPIRVELSLWARYGLEWQDGYTVIKLEPSKLDRESAYGTLAAEAGAGGYEAVAESKEPLVHDGRATFSVQHADTGLYAVPPGTNPTAEINATGKVVYGYNLRVGEPGDYYITFKVPNVDLVECNHALDADEICDGDTTKIRITVQSGGGGGGGGGGKPSK
jgi:hypothetical protein